MDKVNYKWELRKGSRKERCPRCGQRRFVPYVSANDHKTLADVTKYGRCDREQHCGYQCYPNGLSDEGIAMVEVVEEPPLRFSLAAVQTDTQTNLYTYIRNLLNDEAARAIWERYRIGRDGSRTVFWQIAADGTIRAGKSIPYQTNGHRIKTDKYPANWLHKSKYWKQYTQGARLEQCFFGEHLLAKYPTARVVVVESEKTAAIMSQVSNGCVWLASGGSQGLKNAEKNKVLRGRDVLLIPDHGQFWAWSEIARKNGWQVSSICEKYPIFEGCDILDMYEAGALF